MSIAAFDTAEERSRQYRNMAVATIKAASSSPAGPVSAYGAGVMGLGGLGGLDANTSRHAEQLRYFRDWVYTAISPPAKRLAGQQWFVASLSATAAMRATKEWKQRAIDDPDWAARLHRSKISLPECFKSLGERLDPIDDHPLLEMLAAPNEVMVQWQLTYLLGVSLGIAGETIWWLDNHNVGKLGPDGKPLPGGGWRVWPIPAHWATPIHTSEKLFHHWEIKSPKMTQAISVPGEFISYFYMPDPSDPLGSLSPVQAHARSIATDDQIQSSQYHLMKDGIRPDVILTAGRLPGFDNKGDGQRPILQDWQRSQLVEAIKYAWQGPSRMGEPAIIDGLIENISPFSRSPQEMCFPESGEITKNRIMLGLGVNSISAGEVEGVNRASSAVADEHLCSNVVNPVGTLISQVASVRVAPFFARPGEKLICWIAPARAHDPELKIREWQAGYQDVTPNEFRTNVLNLPKMDDEFADTPHYKIPKLTPPMPGADGEGGSGGSNGNGGNGDQHTNGSSNGNGRQKPQRRLPAPSSPAGRQGKR